MHSNIAIFLYSLKSQLILDTTFKLLIVPRGFLRSDISPYVRFYGCISIDYDHLFGSNGVRFEKE